MRRSGPWAPSASISTALPTTFRAQRSYGKLGFTRDGVMRQAYRQADGTRTDLVMMAILKSEWEARALTGVGGPLEISGPETSLFKGLRRD